MSSAAEEEGEEVGGGGKEEGERRRGAIEVDGEVDGAIGCSRELSTRGQEKRRGFLLKC